MRKILVQTGQGANYHIRNSLVNAWRSVGYEVYFWDDSGKSPFDAFREFNPDILLSSTWQLNRAIVKCINSRPELKTILYADIWGDIQASLDLNQYPVGIATDEQKKYTDQLDKIPFIITNHGSKYVEATHGGWRNLGCKPESVLVSADTTQFFPRDPDERYKVQIAYVGGYWPYKSRNLNTYIFPLTYPTTKWAVRLFGSGWNTVNSLGQISDDEAAKHYTNASIIPHCVESHCSDIYQDLPLRYFQVASCGGFGISCPCIGIRDVFDETELVVAENPTDFFEKVVFFLNNPMETESFRHKAMCKVMGNHTGLHRVKQLMDMIGEDSQPITRYIEDVFYHEKGSCASDENT